MKVDGRMTHEFQEPTMACDDAGVMQGPYDEAWGDVSGKELGPGMVRQAREEEMKEFKRHGVHEKVPPNRGMQAQD
eukprot:13944846-Alexandrium_andersonii.AAC.1